MDAGRWAVKTTEPESHLRVDSWLFRVRLYKSRSLAATAVTGGRVHLNGSRVKSSRGIKPGDELTLSHPRGRYRIRVATIPSRRGPMAESEGHYELIEFEPAKPVRVGPGQRSAEPRKRPDKRGRRRLRALKGKG